MCNNNLASQAYTWGGGVCEVQLLLHSYILLDNLSSFSAHKSLL